MNIIKGNQFFYQSKLKNINMLSNNKPFNFSSQLICPTLKTGHIEIENINITNAFIKNLSLDNLNYDGLEQLKYKLPNELSCLKLYAEEIENTNVKSININTNILKTNKIDCNEINLDKLCIKKDSDNNIELSSNKNLVLNNENTVIAGDLINTNNTYFNEMPYCVGGCISHVLENKEIDPNLLLTCKVITFKVRECNILKLPSFHKLWNSLKFKKNNLCFQFHFINEDMSYDIEIEEDPTFKILGSLKIYSGCSNHYALHINKKYYRLIQLNSYKY